MVILQHRFKLTRKQIKNSRPLTCFNKFQNDRGWKLNAHKDTNTEIKRKRANKIIAVITN